MGPSIPVRGVLTWEMRNEAARHTCILTWISSEYELQSRPVPRRGFLAKVACGHGRGVASFARLS